MTIEEALNAYLKSVTAIAALVGQRIYPDTIPQDETGAPCLVYRGPQGDETPYLSGEVNDLHRDTFELTAVGPVKKDCAAVRDAILANLGGTLARGLWQPGIFVSGCIPSTISANAQNPADGSERWDRETSVNLMVIWGRR